MKKITDKQLHILVSNLDQLKAAVSMNIRPRRLYIDYHMLLDEIPSLVADISSDIDIYVALPYMMRNETGLEGTRDIQRLWRSCSSFSKGFLVRNMEELAFLSLNEDGSFDGRIICDYGIYMWNHGAADIVFGQMNADEGCLPYELNRHEIGEFLKAVSSRSDTVFSSCIYGHIPMMVSAGCVKKTMNKCSGRFGTNYTDFDGITDRKNNSMKVLTDCRQCLNIIYNSVPLSLHKQIESLSREKGIAAFRIDLTIESGKDSKLLLDFWEKVLEGGHIEAPYTEYTTGHYKRGTE